VEGAVEGSLDAGFVAGERIDGARAGGVVGVGASRRVDVIFVAGELRRAEGEDSGFEGAKAAEAPGGHRHLLDQQGFGGAGGLVLVEERIAELAKFLGIFCGQDGGFGREAVAERVLRDGGAAFLGARAGGLLRIAAIGVELAFGNHGMDSWGEKPIQDSGAGFSQVGSESVCR